MKKESMPSVSFEVYKFGEDLKKFKTPKDAVDYINKQRK